MWYFHDGMGIGWWWVIGGILFILFWALVIALIIWFVRALTARGGGSGGDRVDRGTSRSLEIARERYARGEISKEEFDTIKKDLSG